MSPSRGQRVEFEQLLTAMNRMGDIIDQQLMEVLREQEDKPEETAEERLERLERALIRQKLVNAFLFSTVASALSRDPLRGPARLAKLLAGMAKGSDEEWQERLAELTQRAGEEEAATSDGDGAAGRTRASSPPPTAEEIEVHRLQRQRRREASERATRRTQMIGR